MPRAGHDLALARPMANDIGLQEVLLEEDRVWRMAARIAEIAEREDLCEFAEELAELRAFLDDDFEVHLDREEADLFPALEARGLEAEVAQAKNQHVQLRKLRAELQAVEPGETEALRRLLIQMSQAVHCHVRYEADFLYCDLTRGEASTFRNDVDCCVHHARER
jgi:hypothetical protein